MAKEDGIIAAPEKLRVRLAAIEDKVRAFQIEAQGQINGLIMGAADAADIEIGADGWAYEREYNRFRVTTAKRPGDRGWPPEHPANLEVLPPKPTEQEVTPPANGNGHAPEAVKETVPVALPRRVRRAAAREQPKP